MAARERGAAVRYLLALVSLVLLPMLPERYQRRWPWTPPASLEALGTLSAYGNTLAAAVAGGLAFILYQQSYSERVTELIANETGDVSFITWYGALMWISFFFTPVGLLCLLYLADSAVRVTHTLITGSPMGSLFFALPLWLWELSTAGWRERRMRALYGPAQAPDRITHVGDGFLLRANRPHEEWTSLMAFSLGDRLYQLASRGEGADGQRRCYEYRFRPWPDHHLVRRIVVLDPRVGPPPESSDRPRTEEPASSPR
jgi:hypothetical protein